MSSSLMWGALAATSVALVVADECASVANPDKIDCGSDGIDQGGCEAKGCCWAEATPGGDVPYCFYKDGDSAAPSCPLAYNSTGAPVFAADEVAKMRGYFLKNINVDGSGAVVAAPDFNTPGGSYYYHWMRDGALSTAALLKTAGSVADVTTQLDAYVGWVKKVQNQADPNGQSVLSEPKFEIPGGKPYTGGWCRPQNDGPGLRASSLMAYSNALDAEGKRGLSQYSADDVWALVKTDLDWLTQNWDTEGCDLWEELRSTDLFWDRYTMRASLMQGSAFAQARGDGTRASTYSNLAKQIESTLAAHYRDGFIYEETTRQKDSATMCAFNNGYMDDGVFAPTSKEVVGTIAALNSLFCAEYAINQEDTKKGVPGILYGRYKGDVYANGNPWVLLTAALAEQLYRAAIQTREQGSVPEDAYAQWAKVLRLPATGSAREAATIATAMAGAADGVLERIRYHVKGNDFHLSEQLDRNTGFCISAGDLTWSYAATLKAVKMGDAYYGRN